MQIFDVVNDGLKNLSAHEDNFACTKGSMGEKMTKPNLDPKQGRNSSTNKKLKGESIPVYGEILINDEVNPAHDYLSHDESLSTNKTIIEGKVILIKGEINSTKRELDWNPITKKQNYIGQAHVHPQ